MKNFGEFIKRLGLSFRNILNDKQFLGNIMQVSNLFELVENNKVFFHHSARYRAYISRKSNGIVEPYRGRFGAGYVHYRPAFDSTTYCFVDYYIFNK